MEQRFDLYRKYQPQIEDLAGTVTIWEARVFTPRRAVESAVVSFPSMISLTSLYIVLFFIP